MEPATYWRLCALLEQADKEALQAQAKLREAHATRAQFEALARAVGLDVTRGWRRNDRAQRFDPVGAGRSECGTTDPDGSA